MRRGGKSTLDFINALRALDFVVLKLPVLVGLGGIALGTLLDLPLWARGLLTLVLPLLIAIVAIARLTTVGGVVPVEGHPPPGGTQEAPPHDRHDAPLGGRYFRDQTIRIADLAREEDIISGRTFEDCTILGPAVLGRLGTTLFHECFFDSNVDTLLIQLASEQRVIGPIGVEHCTFRRCRFRRIGLLCVGDECDAFRRNIAQH